MKDIDELLDPLGKTHKLCPAPKKLGVGKLTGPAARRLVDELLRRFAPQDRLQKIPVHNPGEVLVSQNTNRQELEELARKGLVPTGPRRRQQNTYQPLGAPGKHHQLPPRPAFDAMPTSVSRIQSRKRRQDDRDGSIQTSSNDYHYGRASSGSKRRVQVDRAANPFGGPQIQSQNQSRNFGPSETMQNGFGVGFNPSDGPSPNFPGLGQIPYPPPALNNFGRMPHPSQAFTGMAQNPTPAFNIFGQMLPMPQDPNTPLDRQTAMNILQAFEGLQNMVSAMTSVMNHHSNENANEQNSNSAHLCPDFATNGFCSAGPSCPYTHGETVTVPPTTGTFDPTAAVAKREPRPPSLAASFRQASNGNSRGQRWKYPVWASKSPGSRFNSTLVVMRIPEKSCNEENVREVLGQFGNILEVLIHANDCLALVRYDNIDSVHNVFRSPAPLFNSKHVRLSWYRPDLIPAEQSYDAAVNGKHMPMSKPWDNLTYDQDEFAKKNAEDQKRHEQLQLAKKWIENIEERLKIRAELRAKGHELPEDPELLEYMKEKAARLEAQMKEIDQRNDTEYYGSSFFSRGGSYHRGAYRGRPCPGGKHGFCSVSRLDNRPRSVSLTYDDESSVESSDGEDLSGLTPEQIEERVYEHILVSIRFGGECYHARASWTAATVKQMYQEIDRSVNKMIENERARHDAKKQYQKDEKELTPLFRDLLGGEAASNEAFGQTKTDNCYSERIPMVKQPRYPTLPSPKR